MQQEKKKCPSPVRLSRACLAHTGPTSPALHDSSQLGRRRPVVALKLLNRAMAWVACVGLTKKKCDKPSKDHTDRLTGCSCPRRVFQNIFFSSSSRVRCFFFSEPVLLVCLVLSCLTVFSESGFVFGNFGGWGWAWGLGVGLVLCWMRGVDGREER